MGNEIPTVVRDFIRQRDTRCVRCGSTKNLELSHRMRRREGGHLRYGIIRLCHDCHAWCHAHPAEATTTGYMVSAFITPETMHQIPVLTRLGWATLTTDGEWVLDAPLNGHTEDR